MLLGSFTPQSAERLRGLSGGALGSLKALAAQIESEQSVVRRLEDALSDGAWTNGGAEAGEYDSYQPLESVEVSELQALKQEFAGAVWGTLRGRE